MRARRHAGVQRDPADVPAHHLGDHAAVVCVARGAQAVHGLGRDLHSGVESERVIGRVEVVVDGLRHADDPDALVREPLGRGERAFAADRDDGVDLVVAQHLVDPVDTAARLERVRARRAEDGAALLADSLNVLAIDRDDVGLDRLRAIRSGSPTKSMPCSLMPVRTAPRMTAFRPGASPPLVRIPILIQLSCPS